MTKRNSVSSIQNIWFDSEQVDAEDLSVEQNYNNSVDSSIINNHIGTGILTSYLENRVLFDSNLIEKNDLLDGSNVTPQNQPSDNNYGNQLEIELSRSNVAGKRSVKIAIIGLNFNNELQYETFTFKVNESQITKKHYTSILQILINDFRGEEGKSFNLGGRILIKEAQSLSLSRDTLTLSQNVQPNIFFRDFFVSSSVSPSNNLIDLLKLGLYNYNADSFYSSIKTISYTNKVILPGDVTTQVGQKFKGNFNNMQKVTLLLSATNPQASPVDDFLWTGEIVVSVYALQTSIQSPTDVPVQNLIEYSPYPSPLAQISFNYNSLKASGVVLDTVPQPVDIVFSNTSIGKSGSISPDSYYAITIKRSGSSDKGNIVISTGDKYLNSTESKLTIFNGSVWIDSSTEDLWFEIKSDSSKITDGQAYLSGVGVYVPKTIKDDLTGSTIDYCLNGFSFSGSDTFKGVVFSSVEKTGSVQDLRTGNMVYSRQQNVPDVRLLSTIDVNNLNQTTDTLLIGNIRDKNVKFFDPTLIDSKFSINLKTFSYFNNEIFIKIVDNENALNYDKDIKYLETRFLSGELTNAKFYPNQSLDPNLFYRISSAELISAKYGDLNGDGIIDESDQNLLKSFIGFDLNQTPPLESTINQIVGVPGQITFVNGYNSYVNPFKGQVIPEFWIVNSSSTDIIHAGVAGSLAPDLENPRRALFLMSGTVPNQSIGNYLVIRGASGENNGGFKIVDVKPNQSNPNIKYLVIEKILLSKESLVQIFASDIEGNYQIDNYDFAAVSDFITKKSFNPAYYPQPDPDRNVIGNTFKLIRLTLEKISWEDPTVVVDGYRVDRNDDYYTSLISRNSSIHLLPDLFDNSNFQLDPSTNPISINFEKQLSWEDYLVVSNSKNRPVASAFLSPEDTKVFSQDVNGVNVQSFNFKTPFDPGRVDYYFPDNLIIGEGGEIIRENGDFYRVDFEVGTIVLEIPPGMTINKEYQINVFDNFISEQNSSGTTTIGFPAMKFADGSFVQDDALSKNQIRLSASIQSYSRDGGITDDTVGVSVDYNTGMLSLNFPNVLPTSQAPIFPTLITKVQVNVFLKKGGFQNQTLQVEAEKLNNILKIINSAGSQFGIAPIKITLEDISDDVKTNSGLNSDNKIVITNDNGYIDSSLIKRNPHYIYGIASNSSFAGEDLYAGAMYFDINDIADGYASIYFECIVKTDGIGACEIELVDNSTSSFIDSVIFSNLSTDVQFERVDVTSNLPQSSTDNILRIINRYAGSVNIYMARLAVIYNVP